MNQKSPAYCTAEKSKLGKRFIFYDTIELISLLYFIDYARIGKTITLTPFNFYPSTFWHVYKALSRGETKIKSNF